jgi:Reverse transcriptase (RNA-dependent DNA polymerase)
MDSHPLPYIDNILANCAKGKIWSVINMTNSFFQTRVHPYDIHLTAVTTPLELYKWLVMLIGLCNSPTIHQHRITAALHEYSGKICHIYLNNIVIWSDNIAEHTKHVDLVMKALEKARLHCNLNKCKFSCEEIDFLGHHMSIRGIKPNSWKIDHIMQWLTSKSSTDVCAFLDLVQYITTFLP